MTVFHTVKEAAQITGKSSSSIRRIIYPIISAEMHADREHVRPTVEEVKELRLKGVAFPWQISDELLRREVPEDSHAEKGSDQSGRHGAPDGSGQLIAMLQAELTIKNEQIATQSRMMSQQMEINIALGWKISAK